MRSRSCCRTGMRQRAWVATIVFVLSPFVLLLRGGLPPDNPWRVVVWRHSLRNALIPIITVVGLYLGILIGNSVLTEIVFNRPGLGKLIVSALNQRDYTVLQGMMVVYAFIIVLVNLLTDLTYGFIDPRVKRQ